MAPVASGGYRGGGQQKETPRSVEQGRYHEIADAYCEPRPDPLPPIMVGGMGERYLLGVVAQHADWWNYGFTDPPTYAHNQEVLKQHCRDVGRDYDEIKQVVRVGILIAETERDIRQLQQRPDIRPLDDGVIGTPEQVAEALLAIIDQGADRLTVHFADAPRLEGTELFAASVLPLL